MNKEEKKMNIEEEIRQAWHDEHVRYLAKRAEQLNCCSEMIKLELAKPELDIWGAKRWIMKTDQILTFEGAIPSELMWNNFMWKDLTYAMPNLAKELKENYDKLKSKVLSSPVKIMSLKPDWARKEDERRARKAKLPWYKRWFA